MREQYLFYQLKVGFMLGVFYLTVAMIGRGRWGVNSNNACWGRENWPLRDLLLEVEVGYVHADA